MSSPMAQNTSQGQQVVAPGANRSGLVFGAGVLLIGANMLINPAYRNLIASAWGTGTGSPIPVSGANLVDVGVQFVMVLLLTGVAAVSDEAGTVAVTLIIGLWLVFLVMRLDVVTAAIQLVNARG